MAFCSATPASTASGPPVGPVERVLAPQARGAHAVLVRDTAKLLSRDLGGGRPMLRRTVA